MAEEPTPPNEEGSEDASKTDEEAFRAFIQKLVTAYRELGDIRETLHKLWSEDAHEEARRSPESPARYGREILEMGRHVSDRLEQIARDIRQAHTAAKGVMGEHIDPRVMLAKAIKAVGDEGVYVRDKFAREVWEEYDDRKVHELNHTVYTLKDLKERVRQQYMEKRMAPNSLEREGGDLEMSRFLQAHFRIPIIEFMAERAVLNGGTPPTWEKMRWQDRVQMALIGPDDAPVQTLRCFYFVLVQLGREYDDIEYDDISELKTTVGEILDKSRTGVHNALKRDIKDPPGGSYFEDLNKMLPETKAWNWDVEKWRAWLKDKKGLELKIDVSQESV